MKNHNYKRGKIFVLSAPSGGGKTTLVNSIRNNFNFIEESVSCTTRAPRDGEVEGRDYFFLTDEDFRNKIEEDYFIEWAEVHGYFYGTPKKHLEKKLEEGAYLICDIDIQGAINLKHMFKDEAVLIFIIPPSMEVLKERLERRGLDDRDVISKRLKNAKEEVTSFRHYKYFVVNDKIEDAAFLLESILHSEINGSISRNIDVIKRFL